MYVCVWNVLNIFFDFYNFRSNYYLFIRFYLIYLGFFG